MDPFIVPVFYNPLLDKLIPRDMRPVSVGIVSIGGMGLGIAKILQAHGYRILTVANGRRLVQRHGDEESRRY